VYTRGDRRRDRWERSSLRPVAVTIASCIRRTETAWNINSVKPCPHCRRKVRLSPKTAKFGDCRTHFLKSCLSYMNY